MMPETPQSYTAAQFARALGVTPRAMRARLAGVAPAGTRQERGQAAKAWSLASLPESLRNELSRQSEARGMKSADQLLADPPALWQPPQLWHTIGQAFRDRAEKLAEALAVVLSRQHDLPGPELMEMALARYRQVFRSEIEAEKLRYVMDRATRRDNGFGQWHRPDLYLDDAAFHAAPAPAPNFQTLHNALDADIALIEKRSEPTAEDRMHLFHAAFKHLEKLAESYPSKGEQNAAKRSLVEYLYQHVPGLYRPQTAAMQTPVESKPLLALRRAFNLAYGEWTAGGRAADALRDRRAVNSGRNGYECPECEKLIKTNAAAFRGTRGRKGNVSLAIKQLSERKLLCADCLTRFHPDRLSSTVRQRVTPNVIQVAGMKGAEEIRKIAPTHHTRWDTQPADRFVIDDMTTNELAWDEVDGEIISGQAQMLFTEDEFSAYPLPFLLYFGHPNSRTIKKEISLVLTLVGLPHLELVTERGVFGNRQLAGERGIEHQFRFRELQAAMEKYFQFDAVPDEMLKEVRKRDLGLRDPAYRLSIRQACSPQAKTVERSFFEFQKPASRLPGHAGFNQRNEMSRKMQDFQCRVQTGKEHPGNEYLHLSDLRKNYEAIFAEIANRPVNGMRHRGRSPAEVWKEGVSARPLRKLPEEIEACLATHRLPKIKVHSQGVRVTLSKDEDAYYFNEHTGPLVGQHIAIRVNYDTPDYIYLEHPKTGALLKVTRAFTKRTTATNAELAKVNAARRAHINGALAEIGNTNPFTSWIVRDKAHSPSDVATGAQIAADAAQHKDEMREKKRLAQLAATLGTSAPSNPRNLSRVGEGLEWEKEILEKIAAQEDGAKKEPNP